MPRRLLPRLLPLAFALIFFAIPGTTSAQSPHPALDRLRENLQKLDLTEQQRADISAAIVESSRAIDDLRNAAELSPAEVQQRLRPLQRELRRKIGSILTLDQQQQLRELMQSSRGDAPEAPKPAEPARESAPPAEMMTDPSPAPAVPASTTIGPPAPPAAVAPPTAPLAEPKPDPAAIGQPAPDFNLKKLDNLAAQLSAYRGKVLVVIAGSWSLPVFRRHADDIEKLKVAVGTKASFLILYTREAHPADAWQVQRNIDDNIAVDQPRDDAARRALARTARESLKLTIPIAVDTMDNATADALGVFPNGVVIISRDGKIAARQKWLDPYGLPRLIDEVAEQKPREQ